MKLAAPIAQRYITKDCGYETGIFYLNRLDIRLRGLVTNILFHNQTR